MTPHHRLFTRQSRLLPRGLARLAAAAVLAGAAVAAPIAAAADDLEIRTLSNRADLVSGDDVLVQVVVPAGVDPANVRVTLNGDDVTGAFAVRDDGRFIGLVDGLLVGQNDLRAYVTSAPTPTPPAHLTVVNHPTGGPLFAGAQLQPWVCARPMATPVQVTVPGTSLTATVTSRVSGLPDGPLDEQCNASTRRDFFYQPKAREGGACQFTTTGGNRCFEPYDPAAPPSDDDIANFTNDRGDTVKSIIVVERGAMDRAIYQLVTFFDPRKPSAPWAPQRGWNGKVLWRMGASSQVSRFQTGPSTSVFHDAALRRGFMVVASSFTDHGTNANDTLGAEMMAMVKEHIIETYGPIRYTIGDGCSGGSIMQHAIASAYPGLLDGIQPNCSYPDTQTTGIEVVDCGLLQSRYYNTADGAGLTAAQRAAINGHPNTGFCTQWVTSFLNGGNPTANGNCGNGWPAALTYNPTSRPDGVRCSTADHIVSMVGTFVDTDGITKANRAFDNEGVQYGLKALRDGVITPEQFVRLNEGIGGYTADLVWTGPSPGPGNPAPRSRARAEVLPTFYSGGLVSDGRQLAKLPVIDLRGNQTASGDIHMNWRAWAVRDRLDRDFGDHDNHVIWAYTGNGGAGAPGAALALRSFLTLDEWLTNIENDPSDAPIEEKVRANKPEDVGDMCLANTGGAEPLMDVGLGSAMCATRFTYPNSPRQVAGGPLAENISKCQLKPLEFDDPDYGDVSFTAEQQDRLRTTFPTGVCDWTQPGVGQMPAVPFTTFADGPGGQPLGPEPASMVGPSLLSDLGPARVWIGLRNSDDAGTRFDLRVDVLRGDTVIGSGQVDGVTGGNGFNNAKLTAIPLSFDVPLVNQPSGTVLTARLSARITCSGKTHASGAARFWYNDAQAASRIDATIDGVVVPHYVQSGGVLGLSPGSGPRSTIDVALNNKVPCNAAPSGRPFTAIGSWSMSLP